MSEMKIILERWKCFSESKKTLNEAPQNSLCPQSDTPQAPEDIGTIGELYNFILAKEPGRLQKFVARAVKPGARVAGVAVGAGISLASQGADVGASAPAAAAAAESLVSEVVTMLLANAAIAFANLPDSEVGEGSAAFYFDHDDEVQSFLRGQEQNKMASSKMSKIEHQVFNDMAAHVKTVVTSTMDCGETLATVLGDVTARAKMAGKLADGDVGGGRVKVVPATGAPVPE